MIIMDLGDIIGTFLFGLICGAFITGISIAIVIGTNKLLESEE